MLIFENRELSTTIIRVCPGAAFELPIRALAWEDDAGSIWLRVTDPDQLDHAARLDGGDGPSLTFTESLQASLTPCWGTTPLKFSIRRGATTPVERNAAQRRPSTDQTERTTR